MDWSPLGWVLDVARSVSALPLRVVLEALLLVLIWICVIASRSLWLRSPGAPSLDDQEPRPSSVG